MKPITLLVAVVVFNCRGSGPASLREKAEAPNPAVDAILEVFERFPIVALGMSHRRQDEADFSLALIRDPRFANRVNDIVVECGNALYQPVLDRYVEGGDVPLEQLRLVWRNTTQLAACEPRQHKELLDAVREVNRKVPAGKKMRWRAIHRWIGTKFTQQKILRRS